jgi:hypothetical protein
MKNLILREIVLVTLLAFAATALPVQAQTMCTMDAMQCPDGSWVGRSGPNCEFVCGDQSGGGSPGYDGNTGSKPSYPTTPAPIRTTPDAPVSDQDFDTPSSSEYVDIMKADIESGQLKPLDLPPDIEQAGRIEQEDPSTKEDQSSETGYLKKLLDSVVSFIGGLFNWN